MTQALAEQLQGSTEPAAVERVRLRAKRLSLWLRHLWLQGSTSAEQGLAITHAEVDRLLQGPDELAAEESLFYESEPAARELRNPIARADLVAGQDRNWQALCRVFSLSPEEADLLALTLAVELEPGLRRVYAYLHDDVQAVQATPWLAAHLFGWAPGTRCLPDSNLVRWRLARPLETAAPWSSMSPWLVDPAIVASSGTSRWLDPMLPDGVTRTAASDTVRFVSLHPSARAEATAFIAEQVAQARPAELDLIGLAGSGRRCLAAQIAAEQGRDLVVADARTLLSEPSPSAMVDRAIRLLRLAHATGAVPYWQHAEAVSSTSWTAITGLSPLVLFARESRQTEARASVAHRSIELGSLTREARVALWGSLTSEPVPSLIHERNLGASEVVQVAGASSSGANAMRRAYRRAVQPPTTELLQAVRCPFLWDDLVLAPHVRAQLDAFERQARLRWEVYEEWGFGRLCSLGRGITALFAGPSGTGKTMSAQVIARSLDLELYRVDLAAVVNKYIGETEKQLKRVFDACERADVLLFFDEADALFGKRTQVKDAHDRFANIEINYLLQRMEQFDGVAVLATNRSNDLDTAFLRRLRFSVNFVPPGPEERLRLWQRALLPTSPRGEALLEDLDWSFLSEKLALTGAGIKAAALGAAFLARGEGQRIGMRHVVASARSELTKQGVVTRHTDWKEPHA